MSRQRRSSHLDGQPPIDDSFNASQMPTTDLYLISIIVEQGLYSRFSEIAFSEKTAIWKKFMYAHVRRNADGGQALIPFIIL